MKSAGGPTTLRRPASAEMFKSQTDIEVTHVPYKNTEEPLNEMVAGHRQFVLTDLPPSYGLIKEGKLRALGVTSKTRIEAAPEIPPLHETGVPGFEGLLVALPEIKQQFVRIGLIPVDSLPPDELQRFVQSEISRWAKVVIKGVWPPNSNAFQSQHGAEYTLHISIPETSA
jgi:tripartite-type tricarboxylate transporter receptor subunit TctC